MHGDKMRIVVTGRQGQVARALAQVNTQHELVFLARPEIDLARPEGTTNAVKRARPDCLLSCAAITSVDVAEADEARAFAVNAEAPGELARACAELGVPIIHLSTDYVFGGRQSTPYVESDAPDPVNVYGRSKLAGEQAVAASGARHAIVRPTWITSPFGGFLLNVLKEAGQGREVRVVADQIACPTPGLSLARALLAMTERLNRDDGPRLTGVFHGAGTLAIDRATVAQALVDRLNLPGKIVPTRAAEIFAGALRPNYSALDSTKLKAVYGLDMGDWRDAVEDVAQA